MPVTAQEVAAAKAFLSELPLGIASATGIAAVRTLLRSHEDFEALFRSAGNAAGADAVLTPDDVVGAMLARVTKLREALEARGAEAALLKERNSASEQRLREALEDARKRDEAAGNLEEERQRAVRAEGGLRRAEERLREGAGEIAAAGRRIAELEQLFHATEIASQRESRRAETAEAADRAARETIAEKESALESLRTRMTEQAGSAAENALALERRVGGLTGIITERDQEISRLGTLLAAERERVEELTRSGEAQASYAATQKELVGQLTHDVAERVRQTTLLGERITGMQTDLRDARGRVAELQEAITPFAEMAESYDLADAAWVVDSGWCEDRKHRIVVADFRAARLAALGATTASGSPLAPDLLDEKEFGRSAPDEVREETPS